MVSWIAGSAMHRYGLKKHVAELNLSCPDGLGASTTDDSPSMWLRMNTSKWDCKAGDRSRSGRGGSESWTRDQARLSVAEISPLRSRGSEWTAVNRDGSASPGRPASIRSTASSHNLSTTGLISSPSSIAAQSAVPLLSAVGSDDHTSNVTEPCATKLARLIHATAPWPTIRKVCRAMRIFVLKMLRKALKC